MNPSRSVVEAQKCFLKFQSLDRAIALQRYVDRLRCEFRDAFYHEIGSRNLDVQTFMRSEREDLVRESIAQGIGVSIMPRRVAVDAGLQIRELTDMNIIRRISIVTVKDRALKPGVQKFISLVCAVYDQNFNAAADIQESD